MLQAMAIRFKFSSKMTKLSMYSNYLAEVGKLVYIIGQIETTSSFKKMLDSNDHKSKYFFKCVDELPVNAYKKIKVESRRKGILRCDWFNKILDRSPMMIFMVFNFCEGLDKNQKWEDRLSLTLRRINKVADILRSSNKEEIILRVIVIISKEVVIQSKTSENIIQKINSFLKNYQRELSIFQVDLLAKQISKNRSHWFTMLEKAYERKYRAIAKRKDESFSEKRLGCLIKMAAINQILSRKDSYRQYEDAYKSLHFRFVEMTKNTIQINNFDSVRQLRTLADIVLLRMLIVRLSLSGNHHHIPEIITNHLRFFLQRHCEQLFFRLENLLWREHFVHNLLQVLYTYEHVEDLPKSFLAELINSLISMCHTLSQSKRQIQAELQKQQLKGRMVPIEEPVYVGSHNYALGLEITDLDIVWTQLNQLMDHHKDYANLGLQIITRYKSMKMFKPHQLNFFNINLLRFYLADDKFESIGNIFSQILYSRVAGQDFYLLNNLILELKAQIDKSQEHKLVVYGIAALIADYFKNQQQLEKYGQIFVSGLSKKVPANTIDLLSDEPMQEAPKRQSFSQVAQEPILFPLIKESNICCLSVTIPQKMHPIEEPLSLQFNLSVKNRFLKTQSNQFTLQIHSNHSHIKKQLKLTANQLEQPITITINPLEYFTKDETLSIKSAVLKLHSNPDVHFYMEHVDCDRYEGVTFYTKLQVPEIKINFPYEIYYLNQTSKFIIEFGSVGQSVQLEAKFAAKEDDLEALTQIYTEPQEKLNLINSKCYQILNISQANLFYLKCNKLGPKTLKFTFQLTITQFIGEKELKNSLTITKDAGFRVASLFKSIKILKQAFTGKEIRTNEIPVNKNIMLAYSLRAAQTIGIAQMGQNQSPKAFVKTHKQISSVKDLILTPEQKLKNLYIFEIRENQLNIQQFKNIFLVSFYIKWFRVDMDLKLNISEGEQIKNFYLEKQIKISLRPEQVEVQYQQGRTLKKKVKESLGIRYRNLTGQKIHIYSLMDNTDSIVRIGNKGRSMTLGPRQARTLTFDILPIKSGYHNYPPVRSFFDGIQSKDKACPSILCVL